MTCEAEVMWIINNLSNQWLFRNFLNATSSQLEAAADNLFLKSIAAALCTTKLYTNLTRARLCWLFAHS